MLRKFMVFEILFWPFPRISVEINMFQILWKCLPTSSDGLNTIKKIFRFISLKKSFLWFIFKFKHQISEKFKAILFSSATCFYFWVSFVKWWMAFYRKWNRKGTKKWSSERKWIFVRLSLIIEWSICSDK